MNPAVIKPSFVTLKNHSLKTTSPGVRNKLKLTLIKSRKMMALSPRTMNLNGTWLSLIAMARKSVATR